MKVGTYVTNKDGTIKGRVIVASDQELVIGQIFGPSESSGQPIHNAWGEPLKAGYKFATIVAKPGEVREMKGPQD